MINGLPPWQNENHMLTKEEIAQLPPILDIVTTAKLLDMSRTTVHKAIDKGDIETIVVGERRWVVTRKLLDRLGFTDSN